LHYFDASPPGFWFSVVESLRRFSETITPAHIVCLAGLVVFGIWLLRTGWGTRALRDCPARWNTMPSYLPMIALFAWFGLVPLAIFAVNIVLADLAEWQLAAIDSVIYCAGGILMAAATILCARRYFAGRLKGFGLDPRTIHKDIAAAAVNLLAVCPFVLLAIVLTVRLGKLIWGPQFEMTRHEQLELLAEYPYLSLRILIVVVASVVAPVVEEALFRGLFQTAVRSLLGRFGPRLAPWLAILASSCLFAMAHPTVQHWPALFLLGTAMGYAYEKSGSLFRPIFIHALFNGFNIMAVWLG